MSVVMKFGGSSVADAASLRHVAELVAEHLAQAPVVVLSATAGTTDALLGTAHAAAGGDAEAALQALEAVLERHRCIAAELLGGSAALEAQFAAQRVELGVLLRGTALLRELTPRTLDAIVAHGERFSTALLSARLQHCQVPVVPVDARRCIRTDARFGAARPDREAIRSLCAQHVAPHLGPGRTVVIAGYVGATADGTTTTLGRGGSDLSAALLGAALGCDEVQIWTDVEGVLTADPRVVPEARNVPSMTFAEAAELAAFGARVLHPATIQPAVERGIPVSVRHTRRPQGSFTRIAHSRPDSAPRVTAICSRGPIVVLTLTSTRMLQQSGYLGRVFDVFARLDVPVDLVATAEVAVSCTVEADAPVDALVAELQEVAQVTIHDQQAIVAVVGEALKRTPGLAGRALLALGDIVPEIVSMGGNDINLSCVVPQARVDDVVRRLHATFFPVGPAAAEAT